jgi:probable F420-dependent oxidoreductase
MVWVMRYGFYLPTRGQTATPEALETLVQRGERLGFASVMIADHLVFPVTIKSRYPYTVSGDFPGQGDVLDQLSLMAFVAAKTTRLRLVTSVMIVPYRNPVLTAKALATIDVLSKGRVTLGVGVGWMREEFEALGSAEFDHRGAVTDEYLRIFKTLWTASPASFEGRFYRFDALHCRPQPVQKPHPPIWVGGHSKAALRRAARLGDGWHPVGANAAVPLPPSELKALLDELYRLTEAEGRDPKSLTISYKAPVYDVGQRLLGPGGERRPFSGDGGQVAEDIAAFARLGVSEIVFDFRSENLAESLDRMERFAPVVRQTASI